MQPVILDTDVASLSHKRKLTDPLAVRLVGRRPLITFVTFGELTKWGRLSAAAVQRGRPRPVNDMWIAACCLTYDLPLATLNVKLIVPPQCSSSTPEFLHLQGCQDLRDRP